MRITGGAYKNRKLQVPTGRDIRPTSDRMRQTLFNLLLHAKWAEDFIIEEANILDLYCGSGALGLEALSRGARHCVFIDKDIATIKANSVFIEDECYLVKKAALPLIPALKGRFQLVFMDPPYYQELIEPTVNALINDDYLDNKAVIIIEAEKGLHLNLPLYHLDTRTQSQSNLHVFRYDPAVKQAEQ